MSTITHIHGAQSLEYRRVQFSDFCEHRFTVTTKDGTRHEFAALSRFGALDLIRLPDEMAHELKAKKAEAVTP